MKKFASNLLVFVLILTVPMSFSACKKIEGQNENLSSEDRLETTDPNEIPEHEHQDSSIEDTEIPNKNQFGTIGSHEIPECEYQEISIEDTEILNKDGLSIHIYGYDVGEGTTRALKMRVYNETPGHPVILKVEKLYVDGFSDTPRWECLYENGTITESELEFNMNIGNSIGLWNPGKIDIKFKVEYEDTLHSYVTENMTVYTSLYDASKTYEFPYAYNFYDKDGVRMSVLTYEYSSSGDAELQFLFENSTKDGITIQTDHSEDSLVNGLPIYLNVYSMLDPGEKTVYSTRISKSDLEKAKITKINTISMNLYYKKDSNYKDRIKCDPFTISVQ